MRRVWFVCLIVLLGAIGQGVATVAEEITLGDAPESSSTGVVEIRVVAPFDVHQLSVSCDGVVTIGYATSEDRSVLLDTSLLDYGQEAIDDHLEIVLDASATSRTIELGSGYDAYQVALIDTGLPDLPEPQVGNCNSTFTIDDLFVDCFGTATIAYTAAGEAPRIWLAVFEDGTGPEHAHSPHALNPAETTLMLPSPDPPASWDGSTVVHTHLEWLTHTGGEELSASCTPVVDPTPTEPPIPIDVIVQIIIDIIRSVLADMDT